MEVVAESYHFPKQKGYDLVTKTIWGLPCRIGDCESLELKEIK